MDLTPRLKEHAGTDRCLIHVEGMTNLSGFELGHTGVTDARPAHLRGLNSLRFLSLCGTRVTDARIRKLQQALPKLSVTY
jgi:hypothetical protein